jgi:hypothetical protein
MTATQPGLTFEPAAASGSFTTPRKLVEELKQAGEDHEWYPTTNEIIMALCRDIGLVYVNEHGHRDDDREGKSSILDIGAGNGKVLMAVKEKCGVNNLHAIEKSHILCAELPNEVLVVGTKFEEQSLLSKPVDIIYCNPPYSQFVPWAEKIIREASCRVVYLLLPRRWEGSIEILDALQFREVEAVKVGSFDFEDAEDRKARAKVDLLSIRYRVDRYDRDKDDAFGRFFKEQFADLINRFKAAEPEKPDHGFSEEKTKGGRVRPFHSLVVGPNYPEALVQLYNAEMEHVNKNYRLVSDLDVDLLREFEIFPDKIMQCLKLRLAGLRNDYWKELFDHLNAITERLTNKSRKQLLETLQKHVQVDFTVDNILEVVLWVIKNANRYIDSQLLETYEQMVEKANVTLYKSNHRVWVENRWRGRDEADPNSHYALDYRIVSHRLGGGMRSTWRDSELNESSASFLQDLGTLARNLGFQNNTSEPRLIYSGRTGWTPGKTENFYMTPLGAGKLLFDCRAFLNGNVHLRLNKDFMLALNVEHGRLRGWLRTGKEAAEELDDPKAAEYFKTNVQLGTGDARLLLGSGQ